VEALVRVGANVSLADKDGNQSLHVACAKGHVAIVQVLIANNANVASKNKLRQTPLHLATEQVSIANVQTLLAKGADAKETDVAGRTPLHYAFEGLEALKVDVRKDQHPASERQKLESKLEAMREIIDIFVKHDDDVLDAEDNQGNTPFTDEAMHGYFEEMRATLRQAVNERENSSITV
jgi:ankyrin repeat protein